VTITASDLFGVGVPDGTTSLTLGTPGATLIFLFVRRDGGSSRSSRTRVGGVHLAFATTIENCFHLPKGERSFAGAFLMGNGFTGVHPPAPQHGVQLR